MSKKNRKRAEGVAEQSNGYVEKVEEQVAETQTEGLNGEQPPTEVLTETEVVATEPTVEVSTEVIEAVPVTVVENNGVTSIDLAASGTQPEAPVAPTASPDEVQAAILKFAKGKGGKKVYKGNARGPKTSSEAGVLFVMLGEGPLTIKEAGLKLGRSLARVKAHYNFWSHRGMIAMSGTGEDAELSLTEKGRAWFAENTEAKQEAAVEEKPAETVVAQA